MLVIPVIKTTNEQGEIGNAPAAPFPEDAVEVRCDGTNYVVYQAGDQIPSE